MIREGEVHKLKDLMKRSREQGMISFDQALYDLYQEGEITYEDALKYADSANEVRLMIKLQKSGPTPEMTEMLNRISLVKKDEGEGTGGIIR
jgi:twitching motility protein PilU